VLKERLEIKPDLVIGAHWLHPSAKELSLRGRSDATVNEVNKGHTILSDQFDVTADNRR